MARLKIVVPPQCKSAPPRILKESYKMKLKKKAGTVNSYKYVVRKTRSGKPISVDGPPFGKSASDLIEWMNDVHMQVGEEGKWVLSTLMEVLEDWMNP